MQDQRTDVLHPTCWIEPLSSELWLGKTSYTLFLRIVGDLAGEEAELSIIVRDATTHGCPYDADDQITATYGAWLELSGLFHPEPSGDLSHEQLGTLQVIKLSISQRTGATPKRTPTTTAPAGASRVEPVGGDAGVSG